MTSSLAVLSIEGVLAEPSAAPGDTFAAAQPLRDGLRLYASLLTTHKVFLSSLHPQEQVEHWLKSQGIANYSAAYGRPAHTSAEAEPWHVRLAHLTDITRTHGAVGLWVEADTSSAAHLLRDGITVLVLSRPAYLRGEHRPDYARALRTWEAIEQEVSTQLAMHAEDARLKTEADGRFE